MVLLSTFVALSFTITEALSIQVCGKALADVLDLVCDGRGFHWVQRDGSLPTIDKRTATQYLTKRSSSWGGSGGGSGGGGVVQECCRRSCELSHIESYCAAPQGTYYTYPTGAPLSPEQAHELMRTEPVPAQPITTPRPAPVTTPPAPTPPKPVIFPGRFGKKPFSFFYIRGLIRNKPTRTPFTRYDVQQRH